MAIIKVTVYASILLCLAHAKVYKKCELARELKYVHQLPVDQIATWVCIAKHESSFNTSAINHGSGDHGLFQISDIYWCSPPGSGYACNLPCSALEDDDITDDVGCIRRIFNEHTRISGNGFNAWTVYPIFCKGDVSGYTTGCLDGTDNNVINNGEDEDGPVYEFPPLPTYPTTKKMDEEEFVYQFPPLPTLPRMRQSQQDFSYDTSYSTKGFIDPSTIPNYFKSFTTGPTYGYSPYFAGTTSKNYGLSKTSAEFTEDQSSDRKFTEASPRRTTSPFFGTSPAREDYEQSTHRSISPNAIYHESSKPISSFSSEFDDGSMYRKTEFTEASARRTTKPFFKTSPVEENYHQSTYKTFSANAISDENSKPILPYGNRFGVVSSNRKTEFTEASTRRTTKPFFKTSSTEQDYEQSTHKSFSPNDIFDESSKSTLPLSNRFGDGSFDRKSFTPRISTTFYTTRRPSLSTSLFTTKLLTSSYSKTTPKVYTPFSTTTKKPVFNTKSSSDIYTSNIPLNFTRNKKPKFIPYQKRITSTKTPITSSKISSRQISKPNELDDNPHQRFYKNDKLQYSFFTKTYGFKLVGQFK